MIKNKHEIKSFDEIKASKYLLGHVVKYFIAPNTICKLAFLSYKYVDFCTFDNFKVNQNKVEKVSANWDMTITPVLKRNYNMT